MDESTRVAVSTGIPVEYRLVSGGDQVVVVFHGGHMRAGLSLGEDALAEAGYTVLTPSRPGYGRTPLAAGPSPAEFAQRTAALCSHLGLPRILAVVGVSAGGPTAVAMAAQQPDRVRSLLLQSARSSLPFPSGVTRLAAHLAFNAHTESASWWAAGQLMQRAPNTGLKLMMGSLSTLPAHQVVEDLTDQERRVLLHAFARMRSGAGFANDRTRLRATLAEQAPGVSVRQPVDSALQRQVTQPTLITASRTDGQVAWSHAEELSRNIPGSTTWISPSLSHLIWYGSGARPTNQRTRQFLASAPSR